MEILKFVFTFLAVLSVLVVVHEWGHFIVAKLCGMRVEDFSLFFGKRLFRLGVRNGTEYNVRLIPLGGFVKIAGMEPDDISNGAPIFRAARHTTEKVLSGLDTEQLREVNFDNVSERVCDAVHQAVGDDGRLTEQGKQELQSLLVSTRINPDEHRYVEAVLQATPHEPDPHGYNQKPLWQRGLVIFAGPFMSLFFGYALFCVMGFTTGIPSLSEPAATTTVGRVLPGRPAAQAGLRAGDQFLQIGGNPITKWEDAVKAISGSANQPLKLLIKRDGTELALNVTPLPDKIEVRENGVTVEKTVGRIGVEPRYIPVWKRHGVLESIQYGTQLIVLQVQMTFKALSSFRQAKDNVGGIISIGRQIHQDSQEGFRQVLFTAAMLSIGLGIFNLFPIPVLDGGHLLLLSWEGLRRRKLSSREVYSAQMLGLSIILVLFVLVMYNDIMRLLPSAAR